MAEVNVENIEELKEQFEDQMGFPADSAGLELTEEQLVNFMLLCHKAMHGGDEYEEDEGYEEEGEEMMDDGGMKVKVMKVKGGDMRSIMDELLGHGGPKMDY